jgi:hypothetical protein
MKVWTEVEAAEALRGSGSGGSRTPETGTVALCVPNAAAMSPDYA